MIADQYLQLRSDLETALGGLLKLGSELRRAPATLDTVHGLLADIREPFLFVVVGEVKAGKSSLLNALFGQEFAKVDVLPATDRICIFRYGVEEKQVDVSPKLIERYLPIPFLQDFNLVDTPGTNTMVSEHQTITENFVPRADLVLFTFSVVNPWSQSAWDFLKFVQKKWLKNVVFVLQQADLREPGEIEVIRRHLQDTAMQKIGFSPPIFAVSARQALIARRTGTDQDKSWRESEFGALEDQINLTVTQSGARMLKLRSARQTAQLVLEEIASEIRALIDVIVRDEARLARVDQFVQARKEQTLKQVSGLVRGVEHACRNSAAEGARLLEKKLTVWRTWKMLFTRRNWQRESQMQIEKELPRTIEPQVEHAVQLLEADLRGLWPQLQDLLETRLGSELRTQLPRALPDFARQRRELLQSIRLALTEHVTGKSVEEKLGQLFQETSRRLQLPTGVAAASGIVALIAAMSSAAVADVTGILAASAAVAGGFLAFSQRRKIIRTYESEMTARCSALVQAVENELHHAIDVFYNEIAIAFHPLAAFCIAQRRLHEPLLQRCDELGAQFDAIAPRLG
jgi:GTPase Era involved in 16S rRNA processing